MGTWLQLWDSLCLSPLEALQRGSLKAQWHLKTKCLGLTLLPVQSLVAHVILRARGRPHSYGNSLRRMWQEARSSTPKVTRGRACQPGRGSRPLAHQPLHTALPHTAGFHHTSSFHVRRGPGCFPPSLSQLPPPETSAIHPSPRPRETPPLPKMLCRPGEQVSPSSSSPSLPYSWSPIPVAVSPDLGTRIPVRALGMRECADLFPTLVSGAVVSSLSPSPSASACHP